MEGERGRERGEGGKWDGGERERGGEEMGKEREEIGSLIDNSHYSLYCGLLKLSVQ